MLEIFEFSLSKSGMRLLSVEGEGEGEVGGRGEVREKRQGNIGGLH